jgi:hypothetical protein
VQPQYPDDESDLDECAAGGNGWDNDASAGVGLYGMFVGLGRVGGVEGKRSRGKAVKGVPDVMTASRES